MAGICDDGTISYAYFQGPSAKVRKLCEFLGISDSRKPKIGHRGACRLSIGTGWNDVIPESRYEEALVHWESL